MRPTSAMTKNDPVPGPSAPSYSPMTKPAAIATAVCWWPGEPQRRRLAHRRPEQHPGADEHEHHEHDRVERLGRDPRGDQRPQREPRKASSIRGTNVPACGRTRR